MSFLDFTTDLSNLSNSLRSITGISNSVGSAAAKPVIAAAEAGTEFVAEHQTTIACDVVVPTITGTAGALVGGVAGAPTIAGSGLLGAAGGYAGAKIGKDLCNAFVAYTKDPDQVLEAQSLPKNTKPQAVTKA